jgi:hypothetical protein
MKHKHTYTIGIIALLLHALSPGTAVAVDFVQEKSIAGIATTITMYNVPENAEALLVLPPYGNEKQYALRPNNSEQTVRIESEDTEIAGEYRLSLLAAGSIIDTGSLFVSPTSFSPTNSVISSQSATLNPGAQQSAMITVVARDAYDNVLSNRPMQVISNRKEDTITPLSRETNENGAQLFNLTTTASGPITLRAIDLITGDTIANLLTINQVSASNQASGGPSAVIANQANVQNTFASPFTASTINYRSLYGQAANFDLVEYFELQASPSMKASVDENLVIIAKDKNGLTVEDYEGVVELASTDPSAILPSFGIVDFTGADLGRKQLVLGLRFNTPGNHLLYAEDASNPDINGKTEILVTGTNIAPIISQKISVFSPAPQAVLNTNQLTLQGKGPAFVNLIITGGAVDVISETDATGNFSVIVPLSNATEHTLQVRSDTGTADSGMLTFFTDTVAPEITTVEFDPVSPVAGQDVLITVRVNESAEQMNAVTLTINDTDVSPERIEDTVYQYVYTPNEAGMTRVVTTATDKANNSSQIQSMIEVQRPVIPAPQNVKGTISENIAILQWDPITTLDIDGYRIYIGDENAGIYSYTLETTLTEAKINGLAPGATYYIAITAIQGNRESATKSQELVLRSPKTILQATASDAEVLLEWQSPIEESSVATFRLRYGTQPDNLIEQRVLNGQLRRYTVEDLINETTYYFEIVPITIAGQLLEDAATTVSATPTGSAVHSGAPDPIPANILADLGKSDGKGKGNPPIINPDIIPDQPTTGAPNLSTILLATLALFFGYFIWLKHKQQRTDQAFFAHMQQVYTL